MIPQSFIQDLLARLDIVEVVQRYVPLKRAGANYAACCPFHTEKTPSFTVSPAKQFYHCFGCGAHGSAIGFVMEYAGLGYVDAVKELAGSIGMAVPSQRAEDRGQRTERSADLHEVMARAATFYREQLKASSRAIDYLKGRGLSGEIAARFGIGYAPEGWQNLQEALPDVSPSAFLECGLAIEHESGRRYDRFRDRIMFPILDGRAQVIAFGGRILDRGEPKYLNSPETPLFEKGRELYGLPQARQGIRESDSVIVVEGYMDVVALAQYGVVNAVATLGTATTPMHVQKLLRQARKVVFCFDGDAAGRKAAWRALEASLESLEDNQTIGFLFLPAEHDPDSFVRDRGAEGFRKLADQSISLADFLLKHFKSRPDLSTHEGRSRILHEAKPLLGRIKGARLRAHLAAEVARLAGVVSTPLEAMRLLGLDPGEFGGRGAGRWAGAKSVVRRAPHSLTRTLLKLLLHKPEWSAQVAVDVLNASDAETLALRALIDAVDHGEIPAGGMITVMEFFRDTAHGPLFFELARELAAENVDETSLESVFTDTIEQLRRAGIHQEIRALSAKERAEGLSTDERRRLADLLAQKQRMRGTSEEQRP